MSEYTMQSTVSSQPPRQICTHFRAFCSPPPHESCVSGNSWHSQLLVISDVKQFVWRHCNEEIYADSMWVIAKLPERSTIIITFIFDRHLRNISTELYSAPLGFWSGQGDLLSNGPLIRYAKLRVGHALGMPGTSSPPPQISDPDMHHGTCIRR